MKSIHILSQPESYWIHVSTQLKRIPFSDLKLLFSKIRPNEVKMDPKEHFESHFVHFLSYDSNIFSVNQIK